MIYSLADLRYIRLVYPGEIWFEPGAGGRDTGAARAMRRWSKEMLAVEI